MVQKHIASKKLTGEISLNKNIMADLADLIRLSPTASRILLLFMAYADSENSVITDITTISKLLGITKQSSEAAIRTLIKNGYVEMSEVKLNHENDIIGVVHDKKLYNKTRRQVWKVVGEKLVTTVKLTGTYNRFYINTNIAKCTSNKHGNIIKYIKGNLFYDYRIDDNEIIWEMWGNINESCSTKYKY